MPDLEEHVDDAGVLADGAVPVALILLLVRICAMASLAAGLCSACVGAGQVLDVVGGW